MPVAPTRENTMDPKSANSLYVICSATSKLAQIPEITVVLCQNRPVLKMSHLRGRLAESIGWTSFRGLRCTCVAASSCLPVDLGMKERLP